MTSGCGAGWESTPERARQRRASAGRMSGAILASKPDFERLSSAVTFAQLRAMKATAFRMVGPRRCKMLGPEILARTSSVPTQRGRSRRTWQYHPAATHSKIACWTLLLIACSAATRCTTMHGRRIGFAINYLMVGPINKTSICAPACSSKPSEGGSPLVPRSRTAIRHRSDGCRDGPDFRSRCRVRRYSRRCVRSGRGRRSEGLHDQAHRRSATAPC